MTIAPISEPISGRVSSLDSGDRRATRSSLDGGDLTTSRVWLMKTSESCDTGRGATIGVAPRWYYRVPPAANLPTKSTLLLSTRNGPVSVGLPPPRMLPLALYSHSESIDS